MLRYLKRKQEAEAAIAAAQIALETAKRIAGEQLEKARADRRIEVAALVENAGGLELDDDILQAAVAFAVSASEGDRLRLVESYTPTSSSRARFSRPKSRRASHRRSERTSDAEVQSSGVADDPIDEETSQLDVSNPAYDAVIHNFDE